MAKTEKIAFILEQVGRGCGGVGVWGGGLRVWWRWGGGVNFEPIP